MRCQIGSLRSVTALLLVGSFAGGLSACGGGSGGGSSSPPMPTISGDALDPAINADPASTAPDLLSADGSGTPADNTMLEEVADAARANIPGWADNAYVRTIESDASTDTFVMYSNPDGDTPTPFHMVHMLDTDDSLIVGTTNEGLVSGVYEFPPGVNPVNVTFLDGGQFTGMFDGAPGTYTCVSMCTLSTGMDAELSALGGEWSFAPDDDEFLVPVPDSDYVHFGYWMNESEENDQSAIEVAAIAGGTAESAIVTVQGLEGLATYSGPATGLYVTRTYSLDGQVESRTGGQFTADAMLTATFGGGSVPANDHYSIVGTIKDFMDQRDRPIDSSWTVDLEAALFGSQQGTTFAGATEGDVGENMGAWNGRFFGPDVDSDDATPGNQSTFPSGVAGTFDGQFTNGAVIGSFGAEYVD